jgi:Tfp pilus assembly protein PilO
MSQSSKRILSILLAVVLLIVSIVVYSTFIVPVYADVSEMRSEFNAKQRAVDEQREIVNEVEDLLGVYLSIPQLEEALSISVPNSEDLSSAFNQVHALAREYGLLVDQFGANSSLPAQVRDAEDEGRAALKNKGTVQMEATLIGSYQGIKLFVEAIERNIRVMDIVAVRIRPIEEIGQNSFVATITINTYYQSDGN